MNNGKAQPLMCSQIEMDRARRRALKSLSIGLAAGWGGAAWAQAPVIRVAAASYLKFALEEVLQAFRRDTGLTVQTSYGSSGNFARQIRQGLPVDLFLSADENWVDQLAQAGLTRKLPGGYDRGAVFGRGRLVLYVAPGVEIAVDPQLKGLRKDWARVSKFAIANPEHAPYGHAARQALQKLGLWQLVSDKLVVAENVAQATQYVATGAAQAGLTAVALVRAPTLEGQGRYGEIDERLYAPLRQRMVLTAQARPGASALYDYLQGDKAQQILKKYGAAA